MVRIFISCLFVVFSIISYGQEKSFVREYLYKASEMDSKISCRAVAINQVRSMLLNEIGVYVESESILKTSDVSGQFSQDFVENIATISAGITKLDVLDEKWDGETFWMKASITVDEKSLEESLKKVIKDKEKSNELEELRRKLNEATNEIERLNQKFSKDQPIKNEVQLEKYNQEINILRTTDFNYRGIAKGDLQDYNGAIADFTKAIEIDPENIGAYYNRGNTKSKLNDYSGAIADYTKAIEIDPEDSQSYNNRGIAKANLQDYNGAIADYNKAVEINPAASLPYNNRGTAKGDIQDYNGAIADFTKAIEIDPENSGAYYNRGNTKSELNDYNGAIADYTKAIEIDAEMGFAYNNRGGAKANLKDYNGAIADYNKAIEIDPENSGAYYVRGLLKLLKLGLGESGCLDLSKAGELGFESAYEMIKRFCN